MSYIQVKNITKIYKVGDNKITALNNVSFDIENGELVVILGSSGAGKTTLLNILGGMDCATNGEYIVGETDVAKYDSKQLTKFRRDSIGFVFQFYNLVPSLTAYENVLLSSSMVKDSIDPKEVLIAVGLQNRLNNFPNQLSGGEQQRVTIARALAKRPKLLLCDEPTGALDSKTGAEIISLLEKMSREENKTVIIVTHNSEIAKIADRIIRISDGQIIENKKNCEIAKVSDLKW